MSGNFFEDRMYELQSEYNIQDDLFEELLKESKRAIAYFENGVENLSQYEELNKQVADLRMQMSMRQTDLSARDGEIANLKKLVNELRADYHYLLKKSFEAIVQSNSTIATLVEKTDYR